MSGSASVSEVPAGRLVAGTAADGTHAPIESRPLRILVLSQYPPGVGGGELQTALQLRELVRRGHSATVIDLCPRHEGPAEETRDGVRVIRVRTPRGRIVRAAAYHARIAWQVSRIARSVDVAHVNHLGTGLVTAVPLLKLFRVPCVVVVWGSAAEGVGPFGGGWRFRMARWLARATERQVALSSATIANLLRRGFDPSRVIFIPNGIETGRFRPPESPQGADPRNGPVVITVGRLVPAKGLDVLLDAWAEVTKRHDAARLVVVGEGELRRELQEKAKRLGIEGRVLWLGERADVADLLRGSDLYVSASRTEGMSNALLEALGTGLPVVATRVGSAEDVIEDGREGVLVPAGDAASLARALARLLEDPDLCRSMGAGARRRALAEFSIDSVVERYLSLYREMASSTAEARSSARPGRPGTPGA